MVDKTDFEKIYKVINEILPDFGALVSDIPRIIESAEGKAPTAAVYIKRTIEKLLQDVASRESIIVEEPEFNQLANAIKSCSPTRARLAWFIASILKQPRTR